MVEPPPDIRDRDDDHHDHAFLEYREPVECDRRHTTPSSGTIEEHRHSIIGAEAAAGEGWEGSAMGTAQRCMAEKGVAARRTPGAARHGTKLPPAAYRTTAYRDGGYCRQAKVPPLPISPGASAARACHVLPSFSPFHARYSLHASLFRSRHPFTTLACQQASPMAWTL